LRPLENNSRQLKTSTAPVLHPAVKAFSIHTGENKQTKQNKKKEKKVAKVPTYRVKSEQDGDK
jgi:hypothetical protein